MMKTEEWKQEDWEDLHRTIESFKGRVERRSQGEPVVAEKEMIRAIQAAERRISYLELRLKKANELLCNSCEPTYPEWNAKRLSFLKEQDRGREAIE